MSFIMRPYLFARRVGASLSVAVVLALVVAVPSCRWTTAARAPAPPELMAFASVPAPYDVADPMGQVVWVMRNDMRRFDDLWRWIHEEVPAGPERDRAMAAASLLGISELDRHELTEPGLAAFDDAILAFPDDPRLALWRGFVAFLVDLRRGDKEAKAAGYESLRQASVEYPEFTLFGLTLAVAADPDADEALVNEALDAYAQVLHSSADLQFDGDSLSRTRAMRVFGDWPSAPYNIPGTLALRGDMAARAGDFALAQESYYTALNANFGHRWLWREEIERKLADVEAVIARMESGDEPMLGARFQGALGAEVSIGDFGTSGRIGNGSCTLCHSALDAGPFGRSVPPTGWLHVRAERPPGVHTPLPIFVALPDSETDAIPVGFSIGAVRAPGLPPFAPDGDIIDAYVPAPPGSWMVAGEFRRGSKSVGSTYSRQTFGLPLFLKVRAGEVTTVPQVLEWGPPR